MKYSALVVSSLVGSVLAQGAVPSNFTGFDAADFGGNDVKLVVGAVGANSETAYDLFPLTPFAYNRLPHSPNAKSPITGSVYLNTPGNSHYRYVSPLPADAIALTSCTASDYMGEVTMQATIQQAASRNVTAILLYSLVAAFCNETDVAGYGGYGSVYTLTSIGDSTDLYNAITGPVANNTGQLFSEVAYNNDFPTGNSWGALGGSGSTAVAMIILYAITGIITALFVVIIITGAVRAHRHPERYGPRNVLGRARQSRAKGIARAMLDTIPIVKFGEQQPAKDVEQPHELSGRQADGTDAADASAGGEASNSSDPAPTSTAGSVPSAGVAAADPSAGPTSSPDAEASRAENPTDASATAAGTGERAASQADDADVQTCSICTDDFAIGQDIRVLPCKHSFHPACVDPWLLDVSGTCPLCRVELNPQTGEEGATAGEEDGELPPPLDAEAAAREGLNVSGRRRDGAGRRRTMIMSIFHNRHRLHSSSREERLEALRRYNMENGNVPEAAADGPDAQTDAQTQTDTETQPQTQTQSQTQPQSRLSRMMRRRP